MKVTKGSLVTGAYSLLRISGLTVNATNEDIELGLQVADDYANELIGDGLILPWNQPADYGLSHPSDNSGLTPQMAGPFKKLLVVELCSHFGKSVSPEIAKTASDGLRALEHILVSVPVANNPPTLPIGSGNEYDYRDNKFYQEPATNNGALYVFRGDILNYSYDFSEWLVDAELVDVTYDVEERGITYQNPRVDDDNKVATVELTFQELGGYTLCITATKTGSTDKITVRQNFVVRECQERGIGFIIGT